MGHPIHEDEGILETVNRHAITEHNINMDDVGTLPQGYIRNVPLPRVPRGQSAQSPQVHTIPDYYEPTYVVPTYRDPRSLVESAAFAFSPAWHAIAINS